MSIATEIQRLQNAKSAIATSIANKGVTVPSSTKLSGFATLVDQIQQDVLEKDVMFVDVDGTILVSYDSNELAGLSELPAIPTHESLTPVGWSKTLNEVKALTDKTYIYPRYTITDNKIHIIFEIPAGGADVELDNICAKCTATLKSSEDLYSIYQEFPNEDHQQNINNGLTGFISQQSDGGGSPRDVLISYYDNTDPTFTIDWGDTNTSTFRGIAVNGSWVNSSAPYLNEYTTYFGGLITNQVQQTELHKHHYAAGTYNCTISANNQLFFFDKGDSAIITYPTIKYTKAIYLPDGDAFEYTVYSTRSFESELANWSRLYTKFDGYVVVDDNWGKNGWRYPPFLYSRIFGARFDNPTQNSNDSGAFKNSSIKVIYSTNEGNMECNGDRVFMNSGVVSVPTISKGKIGDYAFYSTHNLEKVVIDEGVTKIGNYVFASDTPVTCKKEIHLPSTITNIGDQICKNIFADIYLNATTPPTLSDHRGFDLCDVYVPAASLTAYSNAANWSSLYANDKIHAISNN